MSGWGFHPHNKYYPTDIAVLFYLCCSGLVIIPAETSFHGGAVPRNSALYLLWLAPFNFPWRFYQSMSAHIRHHTIQNFHPP